MFGRSHFDAGFSALDDSFTAPACRQFACRRSTSSEGQHIPSSEACSESRKACVSPHARSAEGEDVDQRAKTCIESEKAPQPRKSGCGARKQTRSARAEGPSAHGQKVHRRASLRSHRRTSLRGCLHAGLRSRRPNLQGNSHASLRNRAKTGRIEPSRRPGSPAACGPAELLSSASHPSWRRDPSGVRPGSHSRHRGRCR